MKKLNGANSRGPSRNWNSINYVNSVRALGGGVTKLHFKFFVLKTSKSLILWSLVFIYKEMFDYSGTQQIDTTLNYCLYLFNCYHERRGGQ